MTKKVFITALLLASIFLSLGVASASDENLSFGGGYQQPLMYTWKKWARNQNEKIRFWPGAGAFLKFGYRFDKPDWLEIALPVSWSMVRLNRQEWVNIINANGEAAFHLLARDSKFDPFIAADIGFDYMTEGTIKDSSKSIGLEFGAVLGMNYQLMQYGKPGAKTSSLSFYAEVPVKLILFFNEYHLAVDNRTIPVLSFPVRVGLMYHF